MRQEFRDYKEIAYIKLSLRMSARSDEVISSVNSMYLSEKCNDLCEPTHGAEQADKYNENKIENNVVLCRRRVRR